MPSVEGVDTIAVAVPDAYGRLIGKRLTRGAWEHVRSDGALPMPDFHLITGPDNAPIEGLAAAGIHNGFRNGVLRPDVSTMRLLPWHDSTALVLCDALDADGAPAEVAPRWVLRRQLDRLAARGLSVGGATELEFYLYRTSYAAGATSGFRRLRPAYHRAGDNDLLIDGYLEPLLGDVRRLMPLAGIPVDLTQGEGGVGQFEVALRWCDPLAMADRHVVYKHGVKALAQQHGLAATFMAKPETEQAGSSCHVHLSLRDSNGGNALASPDGALTPFGRGFLAGLLEYSPDLCLLVAPGPNSYRRLQLASWAPATLTWGFDNRTTLVRVCGEGANRRFEYRLPGADTNPYLAFAAAIAAGLAGVDRALEPPAPIPGDAYAADAPVLPRDLAEAIGAFERSSIVSAAFGPAVAEHVVGLARHELGVHRREVTDRERIRFFEVA